MADDVGVPSPLDNIRATIFSAKKSKTKVVDFYGAKIELRQPSVNQTFVSHEGDEEKIAMVWSLIDCAYVPGTNDKVFGEADYESLVALPMDQDFVTASKSLLELTGANLSATADSLKKDQ